MLKPTDLILVAFIPNRRDLEIARVLGWYRIPLTTAPKVIAVDYMAFYQPAAFGKDHKWCIEYIASVRGHELVTRAELLCDEPDHPRASEQYFKIQLGPLMKLPDPIHTDKWKRITFFYTTGKYLSKADTTNDLVVYGEERKLLWRALRERAAQSHSYVAADIPEVDVDPSVLALLLGIMELEEPYGRETKG